MATHSGVLAWEIPWTEEPGRLPSMWLQESDMTGETNTFTFSPLAISLYGSNVLDRMQLLNSESLLWASPVALVVKNLPAKQEMWVRSLGQEDPLEKEMATHCSILAWEIPWTEELGGLESMRSQRVGHN